MLTFLKSISLTYFDNDFDTDDRAWVPELWAAETLNLLYENMIVAGLVHTDFSSEVASFGDVVNTRRPGKFVAKRKVKGDNVTIQAATAERVPVPLNQHVHTSFLIEDGEESKSFVDLIDEYLRPAAKSLATHVDRMLLSNVYQFLDNSVGDLGSLDNTNAKRSILDVRAEMNTNLVPDDGRHLIYGVSSETEVLDTDIFLTADKVGDDGTALRTASLGEKLGFLHWMAQNTPGPASATFTVEADDLSADTAAGETVIPVDAGGTYTAGGYITFESDVRPYRITDITVNDLTVDRPIRVDLVAATEDINRYHTGLVDLASDPVASAYDAGYARDIYVDGGVTPQIGQLVSFATAAGAAIDGEYGILAVEDIGGGVFAITLDRPLEAAIANNDVVGYGPEGDYNFALRRDALALVIRPLQTPRSGAGAISAIAEMDGLAIRITITYQGLGQGHLVTLDFLCGTKVLDVDQGAVLLG